MTIKDHHAVKFNTENFENEVLRTAQPVLVDFWADWCPPCKAIGPIIDEIADEFDGIAVVGKVDVDESKSLAERYSISSIPSLLFFKDGEVIDRIQGVVPKSEIIQRLSHLSNQTRVED